MKGVEVGIQLNFVLEYHIQSTRGYFSIHVVHCSLAL